MPLQPDMKIISVDDHLIEHPMAFQNHLPEKYRELGPRIVRAAGAVDVFGKAEDGVAEVWEWEGRRYVNAALDAIAGRPKEEYGFEPMRYDQIRPGCYIPEERIKDMDIDGIWGALCFPTFPRFAGTRSSKVRTRTSRSPASGPTTTSSSMSGAPRHRAGSSRW